MQTLTLTEFKTHPISLLRASDLNEERTQAFRDAINDFCARSGSPANAMSVWVLVRDILSGRYSGEIWTHFEGNTLSGYFINEFRRDLDGKWTLFILHAWGNPASSSRDHLQQFDVVIQHALKNGMGRVQFITRRNERAFGRLIENRLTKVGTLFELRR